MCQRGMLSLKARGVWRSAGPPQLRAPYRASRLYALSLSLWT